MIFAPTASKQAFTARAGKSTEVLVTVQALFGNGEETSPSWTIAAEASA